ncbi:MAG: histidinol dehydrogenase, partial [Eubacterium sp.]|nr:histidinol dehydrogenase [Eubacterium sp.]
MRIVKLDNNTKRDILATLLKRSPGQYGEYQAAVDDILRDVRVNGDEAVISLTEKFDKAKLTPETLRVSETELKSAYEQVSDELIGVMKRSLANIRKFHEKQVRQSFITTEKNGVMLGQRITAIERVG